MLSLVIFSTLALAPHAFVFDGVPHHPPIMYGQNTSRTIYFVPGQSTQLQCKAYGKPEPTYQWTRNGVHFVPSGIDGRVVQLPGQGSLVFNSPEDKDEGVFQCTASNGYGTSVDTKTNFRSAKLGTFYYMTSQMHTSWVGESLVLPCTPPASYPPAQIFWVIQAANGTISPVVENNDVTIDLEGRLRFVNVRRSAEGVYVCGASNSLLRRTVMGSNHTVKVVGDVDRRQPASEFWSSPSDSIFLMGGILRLMCIFDGNPSPDVHWHRVNGQLPDRASVEDYGKTLKIEDVQPSDAGEYECTGMNSVSIQSAFSTFTVRVDSVPYWIDQPQFLEKRVGETATFICRAAGSPDPFYTWYINGVPLADVKDPRIHNNVRFTHPNPNNITLTGLTLEDHMNIQCNASNVHDYLFSDVFLNVIV